MKTLLCRASELHITDLYPQRFLLTGEKIQVSDKDYAKSTIIRMAVRRGELKVVDVTKVREPTRVSEASPPHLPTTLHRRPPPARHWKSEPVDSHNPFVKTSNEDPPVADLVRILIDKVDVLTTAVSNISIGTATRVDPSSTTPTGIKTRDVPVYIPSNIRSGDVISARIKTREDVEDTDLSSAEDALRALRR